MKIKRLAPAVFLFLCGCAAKGPLFTSLAPPSASEATVYIYRLHYFAYRNSFPYVYINDEQKDAIKDEGYLVYKLPPGNTTIGIKGSMWGWPPVPLALKVELQANKIYFFRLHFERIPGATRHVLEQVGEATAMRELSSKKLSE